LWVQDGACQSGVSPIFDRTRENLCSSDTGIAMTRRLLLETLGAYRDHGTRPKGVTDPDVFMVRAVSLRLPPEDRWADVGAPFMRAQLGADFGYEL
jgi:phthalate 4,5-dioxygenase oxygenase subunit